MNKVRRVAKWVILSWLSLTVFLVIVSVIAARLVGTN